MSDEDRAQEVELREWMMNNRSRQEPVMYEPGQPGYGPEQCDECDTIMPPVRRAHGFTLCVPCKTISEKHDSRYRRY